ncbi:MAG: hypothetical protein ACRD10_10620 [Terriglobia bacterium]
MHSKHVIVGLALVAAIAFFLVQRFLRSLRRRSLPAMGWLGLAIILISEALLGMGIRWVGVYFTPLVWTGYILLVDSMVASLEGSSYLRGSPRTFFALATCSAALWLIFEAFNLRLKNWAYVGLPSNVAARDAGYLWAFSTIWPAIFETAALIRALGFFAAPPRRRHRVSRRTLTLTGLAGLVCVAVPVLTPARMGSYLFGLVWIGFAPLLEPINYLWNGTSLLREWEAGSAATVKCFLFAGFICGFIWEFWNYWAHARWIYIFPIMQGWKIFEMPAPGFLGFPAFAVECLVMFEFLSTAVWRIRGIHKRHPEPVISAHQA